MKDGVARIQSRRGFDLSRRWSKVVTSLASTPGHHILDDEMCVLDDLGRSDFDKLSARSSVKTFLRLDLLVCDGADIMSEPLLGRKWKLAALRLQHLPSILFVSAIDTEGDWLHQQALALSLEGIVCKHLQSLYLPGTRSPHWLKVKRAGAVPRARSSALGGAMRSGEYLVAPPIAWSLIAVARQLRTCPSDALRTGLRRQCDPTCALVAKAIDLPPR